MCARLGCVCKAGAGHLIRYCIEVSCIGYGKTRSAALLKTIIVLLKLMYMRPSAMVLRHEAGTIFADGGFCSCVMLYQRQQT